MDELSENSTEKNSTEKNSTEKNCTENNMDEFLDDSNPNTNDDGLPGGVGVSSERIVTPGAVEGTGTHGTAKGRTHGTLDTSEVDTDGIEVAEADEGADKGADEEAGTAV